MHVETIRLTTDLGKTNTRKFEKISDLFINYIVRPLKRKYLEFYVLFNADKSHSLKTYILPITDTAV